MQSDLALVQRERCRIAPLQALCNFSQQRSAQRGQMLCWLLQHGVISLFRTKNVVGSSVNFFAHWDVEGGMEK